MLTVKVEIIRFVDDHQPGWVECRLQDAWSCEHWFVDKVPIFTADDLWADSSYPQPGVIACREVGRRKDGQGREVVTIDTEQPDHVEATSGGTRFDVLPEQLTESSEASFTTLNDP